MGNIIGEGFDNIINKQISVRQEIYGSSKRNNEVLSFLNSRTGWMRMASSVDVLEDSRELGLVNEKLAKQYVLFNGTSKYGTGEIPKQKAGVSVGDVKHTRYAYGVGGNDMGLNPMPGIIQTTIKTETRGSLKTATVKIKCYNKTQFDIIDTLYLRLGFTMLLEWGHSSYYNNDGEFVRNNPFILTDDFLNKKYTYANFYPEIARRRLLSNGNYDAVMGKVVNFDWTFNSDGSYDVTVILRSMGDVIESLKVNTLLPETDTVTTKENKNDSNTFFYSPPENTSIDFSDYSTYSGFELNKAPGVTAQQKENEANIPLAPKNGRNGNPTPNAPVISVEGAVTDEEQAEADGVGAIYANKDAHTLGRFLYRSLLAFNEVNIDSRGIQQIQGTTQDGKETIDFIRQNFESKEAFTYIRLGRLLQFVEDSIIPNVNDKENLFTIDKNPENNIISIQNYQRFTDYRICGYRVQLTFDSSATIRYMFTPAGGIPPDFILSKGKNQYGKIMNAFFNFDFVLQCINDNLNETGDVILIDFLNSILQGFNNTTGNYNKLEVTFEEESNELKIRDLTQIPDRDTFLKEQGKPITPGFFNIYGYYYDKNGQSSAGFVKDFSFRTSITPQLATMITVGANQNGNIIGEDSSSISRMNNGFKDRIKTNITSPGQTDEKSNKASDSSLDENYKNAKKAFDNYLWSMSSAGGNYPKFDAELIEPMQSALKNLIMYDQSKITQSKNKSEQENKNKVASANTGFLPFNLSLKFDGMSGMKVYQRFTVDTDFLPSNYPTSLEFLITSISNTISQNEWVTSLETVAIPKNPFSGESKASTSSTPSNRSESTTTSSSASNIKVTPPENISSTAKSNLKYLYDILVGPDYYFTDLEARGILGVVSKESGFIPKNEVSWTGTSVDRIKYYFGRIFTANGITTDEGIENIKSQGDSVFGDYIYGYKYVDKNGKKGRMGNKNPGDGWKYRGRGYNQLTGFNNYNFYNKKLKTISSLGTVDIVKNPDLVNKKNSEGLYTIAAHIAAQFFLQSKKSKYWKNPTTLEEATITAFRANAGFGSKWEGREGLIKTQKFAFALPEDINTLA